MPRLFLAVPLPEEIKTRIAPEIESLKKVLSDWAVNWVVPENLHITLVFFDWVKEEQIEPLEAEINAAVSEFSPFEIATGKLSLEGRPLWLEIGKGREELQQLAAVLADKLTLKGSLAEKRGFHAHLTLGRVKNPVKSPMPKVKGQLSWKTGRIVLYESRLAGGKRIYEERRSFPLTG